jgi:hypothetical protein
MAYGVRKGKNVRYFFNITFASVQKTIFLLMFAFFLLKEIDIGFC